MRLPHISILALPYRLCWVELSCFLAMIAERFEHAEQMRASNATNSSVYSLYIEFDLRLNMNTVKNILSMNRCAFSLLDTDLCKCKLGLFMS